MLTKIDLKKDEKHLYNPSGREIQIVDVPDMAFLMIDGKGDPNTAQAYKDAVEALYAVSYRVKFMAKANGTDYAVMPLEGLWWSPDMENSFDPTKSDKSKWEW